MSLTSAFLKSFSLKCPACSKGGIFQSYTKLKPAEVCESCSLNFKDFDIGDAPAYFSIFTIGFLIPILAIIVDSTFTPALWVHVVLWVPITILFCYLTLIYIRSIFIHIEYELRDKK